MTKPQNSTSTDTDQTATQVAANRDESSSNQTKKSTKELQSRTWTQFVCGLRDNLVLNAFRLLILSPLIILLSPIVYVPCYRASLKDATFTVDRRERVITGAGDSQQSYYLVWSREGEVFCVTDSWSFLSFDSSDRYGRLHEGSRVQAKVAGWRVPILSWYRNVVSIQSTEP